MMKKFDFEEKEEKLINFNIWFFNPKLKQLTVGKKCTKQNRFFRATIGFASKNLRVKHSGACILTLY